MEYRVAEIAMPLDMREEELLPRAARRLGLSTGDISSCRLYRRAVDARKKQQVHFTCTAAVQLRPGAHVPVSVLQRDAKVKPVEPGGQYAPPQAPPLSPRPIVVGAGPAGLFAALTLAQAGQRPLLIERGAPVEERARDVQRFWRTAKLNPESNVQFGEGGAGAFSDGKLNTGTHDPRIRHVLESLVQAGAPDCILWEAKPHVGTDRLPGVVRAIRERLLALGGEVRFHTRLCGLRAQSGKLESIVVEQGGAQEQLACTHLLLAPGHSARDVFRMLLAQGLPLQAKPFAVGLRVEHLQRDIDRAQYGPAAGHPALGAADYKLFAHLPDGRGVYTFCMCPGGTVVPAASERGATVTNGMSVFARDGENANAALLVGLEPGDFGGTGPLAGVALQQQLEQAAFRLGGSGYQAPAQRLGDFLEGRPSRAFGRVQPSYCRGVRPCDLHACLPDFVSKALADGVRHMVRRLRGFDSPDAVLTGVESRSSSPVRIPRAQDGQALGLPGLFPCGEGAGYAGGIVSAAVDGIRAAEAALRR